MPRRIIVLNLLFILYSCAEDKEIIPLADPCSLDKQIIFLDNPIQFGTDSTFDIITWNIENFPKKDNITVNYVADLIDSIKADIIVLQEINNQSDFQELLDNIVDYDGIRSNSASFNINLATIYSLEVEVIGLYEIYTEDWWSFPRSPQVTEVKWRNIEITIINNHFKANESGTEDEDRRRSASEDLEDYINLNLSEKNVIILGDLNDELTDQEQDNVFMNFISQTCEYLFVDMIIAEDNTSSQWSYPSWPSHIDHILITNELFDEYEKEPSLVQTIHLQEYFDGGWIDYEKYISDHRPVGLRLVFSP